MIMTLGPITVELAKDNPKPSVPESVEDSVVGSEEEQRLQRKAMERQLRDQKSALASTALHSKHNVPGAAPTAAPEQDRVRGERVTEEQLLSYRGKPLVDANGEEIGPISCVYLDDVTGVPKWLGAQVGSLMGSRRVVAPVFGSYIFRDAISAPYSREVLLNAEVDPAGALTPEQDSGLYLHFGIPLSTERSRSGLPAGLELAHPTRTPRWIHAPLLGVHARRVGGRAWGALTKGSEAAVAAPAAATRRVARWRWPWTRAA
jgi:hypothetical protein